MKVFLLVLLMLCLSVAANAQTVNGSMTLTATATDATATVGDTECGIASVQFFLGTTPLGPAITTPTSGNNYTTTWNTTQTANGTYVLTAKATDKAGSSTNPATVCDGSKPNIGTSNALSVTVNNVPPDVAAPNITISIIIVVTP